MIALNKVIFLENFMDISEKNTMITRYTAKEHHFSYPKNGVEIQKTITSILAEIS